MKFFFRIFEIQYFEKLSTDLSLLFLVFSEKVISTSFVWNFLNKIKIIAIVKKQIFVWFWTAAELQVAVIIWKVEKD